MKSKFLLLALLMLFETSFVLAQQYIYKQYTTADGLPSSEVYHVFQDSKGYIWFATDNGVSRYNGYEFENFDAKDGLPEVSTSEIYEDYGGRIWFIGITGMLSYFENNKIVLYPYNDKISRLFPNNHVYEKSSFYIDKSNNIYLGFKRFDLVKISEKGIIEKLKEKLPVSNTLVVHELPDGKRIAVTHTNNNLSLSKISYLKRNNKNEIIIPNPDKIYPQHIFAIDKSDNSFFLGESSYLHTINNMQITNSINFENKIVWLSKDAESNLWICPENKGAYCYSPTTSEPKKIRHLFEDKTISSVLQDNTGAYWFTTLNEGVYYIETFDTEIYDKSKGLLYNNISCIESENNSIWVGYNKNFASKITGNKIVHYPFKNHYSSEVEKIIFDKKENRVALATSGYLYFIEGKKINEFKNNYPALSITNSRSFSTRDFISDKKNGFWISGGNGFYHLKDDKIDYASQYDNDFITRTYSIYLDAKNVLWLGCKDGLHSFSNGKINYFGNKFKSLSAPVQDISGFGNILVIATKSNGIIFFDGKKLIQLTKNNGLTSNTITSVLLQGKTLWAGSLNGLNKIELPDSMNNSSKIKVFNISSLSGFEINQIKQVDSNIYIASNRGLIKFPLRQSKKFQTIIPFMVKNILVNGNQVPVKSEYTLKSDQNHFTITFEALAYSPNQQIQYRYRLKGLDENWIITENREARYYHLDPGKYEFVAKVRNLSGEWEQKPIKIKFEIIPALWQTLYFKIAITIAVLSILLLIFKATILSARNKALLRKNMYFYMMQALVGQMNPHFIFNTLNSINNYILLNDRRSASSYLTKFSKLIRKILENSRNEYITLAEEINALELYLEIEALRLKNKFEYSIDYKEDINIFEIKLPSLLIQPFIENSIWHGIQPSARQGFIKIKISKNNQSLIFDITDNGIGRIEALKSVNISTDKKKSLGSEITASRLALLSQMLAKKANIVYTDLYADNESAGTHVKITIPLVIDNSKNKHARE